MYSTRPYRNKMPLEKVVAEIKRCTGTQFSPKVVEAFLRLAEAGVFNDAPPTENAPSESAPSSPAKGKE